MRDVTRSTGSILLALYNYFLTSRTAKFVLDEGKILNETNGVAYFPKCRLQQSYYVSPETSIDIYFVALRATLYISYQQSLR